MKRTNLRKWSWPIVLVTALTMFACSEQPDSAITAEIKTRMAFDSTVKASRIDVVTARKVVTLTGNLDSRAEKDRALQIARSTDGVASVVDMLEVRTGPTTGEAPHPERSVGEHIDDAVITARVKSRLFDDPQVKGSKIDVDTREGVVFLTGTVRSEEESKRAVEIARGTEHVRDVKPNLEIVKQG
jgi:hyperosmotically inducible protein